MDADEHGDSAVDTDNPDDLTDAELNDLLEAGPTETKLSAVVATGLAAAVAAAGWVGSGLDFAMKAAEAAKRAIVIEIDNMTEIELRNPVHYFYYGKEGSSPTLSIPPMTRFVYDVERYKTGTVDVSGITAFDFIKGWKLVVLFHNPAALKARCGVFFVPASTKVDKNTYKACFYKAKTGNEYRAKYGVDVRETLNKTRYRTESGIGQSAVSMLVAKLYDNTFDYEEWTRKRQHPDTSAS